MRLLVTGGCGFIGSNFIRHLMREHPEDEVLNLDKLTYAGNPENLRDVEGDPRYTFLKGDICEEADVGKAFEWGPEAVVNFAAETHVDRSITDPEAFVRTDVLGTFRLLEAVRGAGVRLVHISTDEVYGSIAEGSFTEESPLRPNSPYAASKAGADLLVRSYVRTYGIDALIVRSSNNYGPYQYPEKVIPLFITNLLEGRKVPLYGEGANVRDWLFVEDNCRAIDLVLRRGESGGVYNVGAGQERSNLELTRSILALLGMGEEHIQKVPDRPGHDFRYSLDCTRIRSLGWEPLYDLERGLRETVRWYRENRDWWMPIKSGEFREYYRRRYGDI
ncbi:dTDP-glucose 4,6-dehydratase [Candidatus Solincola tengchongensis]|uniref:dTDP-glucose 4,6-dehydratase n=1 Tax=Candidatus Solincola tengchongensis TaxID=2900693 RepID=UPI00257E6FF8|nr:dTDP-glucose 4,6-dehydratase [Candidatus Solincola tengchongensis]